MRLDAVLRCQTARRTRVQVMRVLGGFLTGGGRGCPIFRRSTWHVEAVGQQTPEAVFPLCNPSQPHHLLATSATNKSRQRHRVEALLNNAGNDIPRPIFRGFVRSMQDYYEYDGV